MIVSEDADRLVLITQEDHARLTGDLAAGLREPVPHHAAFVAAARVHDNGWREADAAPTVDADGRPHDFSSVPDDRYEDLWRRGIERAAAVEPLVGLLVGLHGSRFFETRDSDGMRRLVAQERQRQDRALAALGLGGRWDALPTGVASASAWLAMLDALSLLLCRAPLPDRLAPRVDDVAFTLLRDGGEVAVSPWPFAARTWEVGVPARRIEARPYSEAALASRLQGATPAPLEARLVPGGD